MQGRGHIVAASRTACYVEVTFTHSYSENSHERANENALIVQSSAGDEMTRQRVHRYGVVLVARTTLTAQRLQSCVDRNGLSSTPRGWNDEVATQAERRQHS